MPICCFGYSLRSKSACEVVTVCLEAFAVDNGGSRLIVLLLADPHLLEGGQGSQDRAADPDGVFALGWGNNLNFHCARGQGCDLFLHSVGNARVHGGATRQHSVGIQVLTDVDVTLHDGVEGGLMDTAGFHSQERGLEQGLGASEPLVANGDDLPVRQLVALLQRRGGSGGAHFLLKVKGDVAQLLLDVTDNFPFGCGGEAVASLGQDLHEVVGQVTASQVQTEDGVGQGISFIDGHSVGHTVARVHHNTSGTTRGIQRQHSLNGNIHGWGVEGLKHDLRHLFSVSFGVQGSLGEQDRVLLWGNTQLIVEGVMPDLLHVIPVGNNTMLNWVLQGQNTPLALSFITNVAVLLTHTDHHALMSWAPHNGWEDCTGSIISGKSSFAHTRAVINNQCGNFLFHG
uniref:Uncharacterized protein n=1 Tax=Anguilla anguilla TaxID=7936 RepID=A0A0E9X9N3_ANGAN